MLYSHARIVTNKMFLEAAKIVAECVTQEEFDKGQIYPSIERIREVSAYIAVAVARVAIEEKLSDKSLPDDLLGDIQKQMYNPDYPTYL